ncbi:MAG: hypothetical protein CMF22_10085 [Idiomarinaceae bacterium]|nr:hypothetical protein [Idiomarinaceae bacterium]MBG23790.1 hypothetical protein [Idiomarinaceae bacterium]|tara:strand:+ start:53073 stop:53348 length:276 start_codon:yes stop_codon:yes gene_type:complete
MAISGYNVTSETSSVLGPIGSGGGEEVRLYLWGTFGSGEIQVEIQMPDGTWTAFPELLFTSPAAQTVKVFSGANVRLIVIGATDVSYYVTD